jgi:hypothetical protein
MQLLYLLLSRDGTQVKIGITKTTATLKTRLASLGGAKLFNLESSRFFHCERAKSVEQFLHFHFRHLSIVPSNAFVTNGKTECFSAEVMDSACQFIKDFSAGHAIPFSENVLLLPVEPPSHLRSLQPTAHVDHWLSNKKQTELADGVATLKKFNEQSYLLFLNCVKNWIDRHELLGLYSVGSDVRIILCNVNSSFGREWLPFANINFSQLVFFDSARATPYCIFGDCFHNQSFAYLKIGDELKAIYNKQHISPRLFSSPHFQQFIQLTQKLASISSVDRTFNPSVLDDDRRKFVSEFLDAWNRYP